MLDDSINVERRRELGRFLRNRRARLRPEDVGLPAGSGHRRVAGLRREEVAVLAGVGIAWYTMLERGTADGVSAETLDAIARALVLSDDETAFVHTLIDPSIDATSETAVAAVALGAFAAIEWAPAYICTARWNVLSWNRAMTLVWDIDPPGGPPFNIVRRMFTDERVRALHGSGFGDFARRLVAMVRVGAGRLVDDPVYRGLEADLRGDPLFAAAWDTYDVAGPFTSALTQIVSPAVGPFVYEALSFPIPDHAGQSIVVQVPDESSAIRLRAALAVDSGQRTADSCNVVQR